MPSRRLPIGAEPTREGTHFRVWAPKRSRVEVALESARSHELRPEGDGYFAGHIEAARAGMRYRFRLDESPELYPDPASRFQPEGPFGPSQIVDPAAFTWTDRAWKASPARSGHLRNAHWHVHSRGDMGGRRRELPALAKMGITLLEVMPVADFPGPIRLGLRRRQSLRANSGSTAVPTIFAASSIRLTPSTSA